MDTNKRILFSSRAALWFFIYLFYMWLADCVRFAAFSVGMGLPVWGSFLLAAVCMTPALWWIAKNCSGEKVQASLAQIGIFALWFFAFFMLRAIFPDHSEDVKKYHILLQEPIWRDMIGYDLIPGAMQGFGFPLPDRLFYPFRAFFGYRMGQVFNLICLYILYLQVIQILTHLAGEKIRRFSPVLAFCVVGQYDAMMQTASYMVELAGLILLMEGLWFLLRKPERRAELFFFALIMGFFFAMKMTNIIYVLPMLVLYLCRNWKRVTPSLFGVCFLAGALPVSIYLLHNFLQVGNPVFPYYNTIFQSEYFLPIDFKDRRWGPQTGLELLLWPFLAIIKPDYRQSELPNPWTWGYGTAWILAAGYGIRCLVCRVRRKQERFLEMSWYGVLGILTVTTSWLWSATTGHARYYMGGFMILLIWGIASGFAWLAETGRSGSAMADGREKKSGALGLAGLTVRSTVAVLAFLVLFRAPLTAMQTCLKGTEWSFRPSLSSRIYPGGLMGGFENRELYAEQLSKIGRDRSIGTEEQREKVRQFVLFGSQSYLAVLFDPEIPIMDWNSISSMFEDALYRETADHLEMLLDQGGAATFVVAERGQQPDLSHIYEYRIGVKAVELVEQDLFWNLDVYLVWLCNPEPEFRDLIRQRPVVVLGQEPVTLGQLETSEGAMETDADIWISTQGIQNVPGMDEEALKHVTVEISCQVPETLADGTVATGLQVLERVSVDCTEEAVHQVRVELPKLPENMKWPEGWERVSLIARLELPEESDLFRYVGIFLKTSLWGIQYMDDAGYCVGEDGQMRQGWIDGSDGNRYYADYYGRLYTGWETIDGKWYYFSGQGIMRYSTWKDGFYLGPDGVMVTGRQVIDGVTYEFDQDGKLME